MLTFWDTVRGTRLADTLIRELPKLTKERKQETIRVLSGVSVADVVEVKIKEGKRYVTQIPAGEDVLVIFE